jgi:hypothetical protein
MLTANEVHANGMRVRLRNKNATAFCLAPDDSEIVSVYVGCKECGRMDDGREVPIENLTDLLKQLSCKCQS